MDATTPSLEPVAPCAHDALVAGLVQAATDVGRPMAPTAFTQGLPLEGGLLPWALVGEAAGRAGLLAQQGQLDLLALGRWTLPVIALRQDGVPLLLRRAEGNEVEVLALDRSPLGARWVAMSTLKQDLALRPVWFLQAKPRASEAWPDAPTEGHWLKDALWANASAYGHAALAGLASNAIATLTAFYALAVYDRVIPNRAFDTLVVLTVAVVGAYLLDAVFKALRAYLVDAAGRNFDLRVGPMVFAKAMALAPGDRPGPPAAMAQAVRDYELLREVLGAATLTVLTDLPFLVGFLVLIAYFAGPVAWAPILGVPLALLLAWACLSQVGPLAKASHAATARRHALLQEVSVGLDQLQLAGAEGWARRRWDEQLAAGAERQMRARQLGQWALLAPATVQALVGVAVTVAGATLVADAKLTTGALVACGILAGRALAPLGPLAGLLGRLAQVKAAYEGLDRLMKAGPEAGVEGQRLHLGEVRGAMAVVGLTLRHPQAPRPALQKLNLSLQAGESVAILGRIGSGKSTLLGAMAGLLAVEEGHVALDGVDLRQVARESRQGAIVCVPQDPYLVAGSVRDNLTLARPDAAPEALKRALATAGLEGLLAGVPEGLELQVGEGGRRLSGGMRQSVALARALLGEPAVLLLDEPTSMMDPGTEAEVVARLARERAGKTTVVVTHRPAMLALVQRVVVLEAGQVVLDGPRDAVLAQLAQRAKAAQDFQ